MRVRSASGSVDSPSAVEPTRSQNRIVTTLRCSRGGAAPASSAPHDMQKRACRGLSTLQRAHTVMAGAYARRFPRAAGQLERGPSTLLELAAELEDGRPVLLLDDVGGVVLAAVARDRLALAPAGDPLAVHLGDLALGGAAAPPPRHGAAIADHAFLLA